MTTTSQYPEHNKLLAVKSQTAAIGEFLEWLQSEHVQLMVYREDLKDYRPTDPECSVSFNSESPRPCDQVGDIGDGNDIKPRAWWMRHCFHWQKHLDVLDEEASGDVKAGHCCRCGQDREYAITTRGWVHDSRTIEQLLAGWAGINLQAFEQEKRAILAALQAQDGSR